MTQTSLTALKGVGPKTEKLFRKIGISSQEELLRMYPRDYDIYEIPLSPEHVIPGEKNAVLCRLRKTPSVKRFQGRSITMASAESAGRTLQINWFNLPYIGRNIIPGRDYVFRGLVTEKNGRYLLQHPEIFTPEAYQEVCGRMIPIYPVTAGLSVKTVRRTVRLALDQADL
ncbi:MAG: ATP-dependent DNA helicase RecG, partial [Eubacterium sp.]|nr:ATP-dependent DNA helicase RecG [Eubacterium sp.]